MSTESENYFDYLPEVFQQLPGIEKDESGLLGRFLKIFQEQFDKIEDKIIRFPELVLDPSTADATFLPYLASWIALELPAGWDEHTRRKLIKQMPEIYRMRGRKAALYRVLKIYLKAQVQAITEVEPHIFSITVNFPQYDAQQLHRILDEIGAVVEVEKPAHTYFYWDIKTPTMQICKLELDDEGDLLVKGHSQVGVDTILGTEPNLDT